MATPKVPAPKVIEVRTWKTRQSAHYEQLANLGKFKIRISITRDSYDFQSHAVASVFDPVKLSWNTVYTIPHPKMATLKAIPYWDSMSEAGFQVDVRNLLTGLKSVLF